ncbi:MAG: DUF1902 domain-containing protein [Oscillospiraceae bacterium]|nr:DUF1902 domain-containing protein [Oscillospiraceae bacterium]
MEYTVKMTWDDEAGVWVAVCDELPIALESESVDELIAHVTGAAPELLELGGKPAEAVLVFVASRTAAIA